MAAPVFSAIGSVAEIIAANTSVAITRPAVSSGDLMGLLWLSCYDNAAITPPSGWTLVASRDANSGDSAAYLYTKEAGGSEPSDYTVALSGGTNNRGFGVIFVMTGTSIVVDVQGSAEDGAALTSHAAPSVTTTVADTLLVGVYVEVKRLANAGITPPGTMTERVEHTHSQSFGTMMMATETLSSSGATGTRTATTSNSREFWNLLVAFKESGGGGGGGAPAKAFRIIHG